jgi:methionine-rich copper-binding protein CopC
MKYVYLSACLALIISGCAGNGDGLDANGRPLVAGGTPPPPLSADFDSIQANIFTPICSVCHAGGAAPEGLRLDAADSYSLLVSVPSTEVPSLLRVKPGDPDNSYIIQKLEGHAAVGGQMPLGCPTSQPCLTAATIAFIAQWISDGAPAAAATAAPASTATAPTSFAVTAMVPADGESLSEAPPQIMIAFNHELDVTQIASGDARIERLGPQAAPSVVEVITARMLVNSGNLKALMVWPDKSLSGGRYRLVFAARAARLADTSGQSITLGVPNEAGDAAIVTFDVEGQP